MSDEEDYNSEEDADYVPSDGELGSEEENSGEEEDLSVLADDAGTVSGSKRTGRKKQAKNELAPRKRKGGIKLEGEDGASTEGADRDVENSELAQQIKEEEAERKVEREKKRVDDLWSSFLSDVKPSSKPAAKPPHNSTAVKQAGGSSGSHHSPSVSSAAPAAGAAVRPAGGKITITKIFDFAGEEIKVTKEVDADSKEAKAELKKQEESEQQKANCTVPAAAAAATSSTSSVGVSPASATSLSPGNSLVGTKRPAGGGGGLGGVLSKIGKKQKMGTLEKSKMDWDSFKKKEGIEEELKTHNKGKDGYIERMSFLNRADVRQFEIERDIRLSKSGKR